MARTKLQMRSRCRNRENSPAANPHVSNPSGGVWQPEVMEHVASFLPPNEVALALRQVDRASAVQFKGRHVVKLSEPSPRPTFAARWSPPAACRGLSVKQRHKLVCLTAAAGDVVNLAVAVQAAGVVLDEWALRAAAKAGHLDACEWLCEPGRLPTHINCPRESLAYGAEGGHKQICAWALQSTPWNFEAAEAAARGGHVELMDWLMSVRPEGTRAADQQSLLRYAASGADLASFQQLFQRCGKRETDLPWVKGGLIMWAVFGPSPDWKAKCDWLVALGGQLRIPEEAYDRAAQLPGGDAVERFVWLQSHGHAIVPGEAWGGALKAGNVFAMRYLLSKGILPNDVDEHVIHLWDAAREGRLGVLRTLHEAGCDLGDLDQLTSYACRYGHVEVVAWLAETFGADEMALEEAAAEPGSAGLLRWLRGGTGTAAGLQGWAPGASAWRGAAGTGDEEALELLHEWGVPLPADTSGVAKLWAAAANNGDLRTLRWLRRVPHGGLPWGPPWGPPGGTTFALCAFNRHVQGDEGAACRAPLAALQWLLDEGCPVDWAAAAEASRGVDGRFEMVQDYIDEPYKYEQEERGAMEAWVQGQRQKLAPAPVPPKQPAAKQPGKAAAKKGGKRR